VVLQLLVVQLLVLQLTLEVAHVGVYNCAAVADSWEAAQAC
jgi:hypothetical protein